MAGKKRRKNRPAPAQQAVPVRRGNEQVRYVQPGRPASYPGAGRLMSSRLPRRERKENPVIFMITVFFSSLFSLLYLGWS